MLVLALSTYAPPGLFRGQWRLDGIDYMMLHGRRVDFALTEIARHGRVPAWYPRELMGTPFWSNVQSFPLLPTRLLLLPSGRENLFTLAVWLSVAISAGATYLWARRLGAGAIGSAAAGWTFVCGGYFASRTAAGQLGMLETYWALPVLLYLVERLASARPGGWARSGWLAGLGLTCGVLTVSAHPQHPVYGVALAGLYVLWRVRPWRLAMLAGAAMGAGVACFAVQLWPMAKLIARSTRTLPLDEPTNDIAMPYGRLRSMVFPWADGAPPGVGAPESTGPFTGYPNFAYFWDTVNFLGWLPLLAAAGLGVWAVWRLWWGWRRRAPHPGVAFLVVASVVALLLALPASTEVLPRGPFIILRSPARLMYVVNFGLSLALAGAVTLALRQDRRGVVAAVAGALLALHAWQVTWHARSFVQARVIPPANEAFAQRISEQVGDGRVGIDKAVDAPFNRRLDDIGFFDSIMLAGAYRSLLDLNPAWPERLNVQELDGGQMSTRSLRMSSVGLLLTYLTRPSERPAGESGGLKVYIISDPAPRAAFFPASRAGYLTREETRRVLRDRTLDLRWSLILPPEARAATPVAPVEPTGGEPKKLSFARPRADRIELSFDAEGAGFVRLLEAYDIGWRATVNGRAAPVYPAHNMAMAIPVPAGVNAVVLEFFTPGFRAGVWGSAAGLAALSGVCGLARRMR